MNVCLLYSLNSDAEILTLKWDFNQKVGPTLDIASLPVQGPKTCSFQHHEKMSFKSCPDRGVVLQELEHNPLRLACVNLPLLCL